MLLEGNKVKDVLEVSCAEFEIVLEAGEKVTGQFSIHANNYVFGEVYSSDTRVRNIQRHFEGDSTIEVSINGEHLAPGEELSGDFRFITNIGEYKLPFLIRAALPIINSSQGEIKNLFNFANLAKDNWDEALDVFYDPKFEFLFSKKDKQYLSLYRGLSKQPGNESNLEEFLIGISKKLPIDYQLDTDGVILENVFTSLHEFIHVKKSSWGYTHLTVDKEGDFFTLSKKEILNEDFDNNTCSIDLFVDAAKLKPGANLGSIHIHDSKTNLCIPVRIMMADVDKKKKPKEENIAFKLSMLEAYMGDRLANIPTTEHKETAKAVLEKWLDEDESNSIMPQLYQVQLLLMDERFNEAKWYLDEIGNRLRKEETDVVTKSYYYYLTTLYNRDEEYLQNVTNALENALSKNKKQWQIAMILLLINEDYSKNNDKKWSYLKEQYDNGCSSPILYGEALNTLIEQPGLLLKLDNFEQHVIWFGIKHNKLSRELQEHVIYLSMRAKSYTNILYATLTQIYSKHPSEQLLTAICRLLILGCKNGNEYFKWYSLAIEKSIRVTGLYEYYMYSMNREVEQVIPKIVLLYFTYQSQLDVNETAFLYRYVIEHSIEEPDIADAYAPLIEHFVIDQIKARRITRDIAFLYENTIVPQMLRDDAAYFFTPLMFMNEITVENPNITSVVLVQERMKGESTYPVENGECQIPIYSEDYELFLQDDFGNRFTKSIRYKKHQMMNYEELLPLVKSCLQGRPSFDFFECEREHAAITVTKKNADRIRRMVEFDFVDESLKSEFRTKLLHFYYDADRIGELDVFLEEIDDEELDPSERTEFMRFLITRGKFDKAYIWLKKYGASGVNQKNIARLVSKRIQSSEYMEDEFLINVAYYVFRKAKYDEAVLLYLNLYYKGRARDLRDIWRALEELNLSCKEIKERILRQMLITKELVPDKNDILLSYEKDEAYNEVLVEQYYENIAKDFFLNNALVENIVLDRIYARFLNGEISQLQKLSLLKYWSQESSNRDKVDPKLIEKLLLEQIDNNLFFAFFKELSVYSPKLHYMQDRYYIEYHATRGGKVKLHYLYDEASSLQAQDEDDEVIYRSEEMTRVYENIYIKECTLFSGEILQYYISEEVDGESVITYSDTVNNGIEATKNEKGRFSKLNDVVISLELSDAKTATQMLDDYLQEDFLVRELFTTI